MSAIVFGPRNRTLASNPVVSSVPFGERHHARVDPRRRLVGDQPLQQVGRGEGRGHIAFVHLDEPPLHRQPGLFPTASINSSGLTGDFDSQALRDHLAGFVPFPV